MEFKLTERQLARQRMAREFARKEIRPRPRGRAPGVVATMNRRIG